MQNSELFDVIIVGGGLAGLSFACMLKNLDLKILILDENQQASEPHQDLRTTAISYGSQKILENSGIWKNLSAEACPIREIEVLDGHSPVLLSFKTEEVEGRDFGWIVLNNDLRAAMAKTLQPHKNIHIKKNQKVRNFEIETDLATVMTAQDSYQARLIVGADGRASKTRQWIDENTIANVRTKRWSYEQRAVICTVAHENPHHNIAVEHFWPQGPFAILPMASDEKGQYRSSVVFTEHGPESDSLMHLSDETFEIALALRFPNRYGDVKLLGPRACYPLSLVHAGSYTAPRMILIADAAHGIHPIAGQGLNLGFRDVQVLSSLIAQNHAQGKDIGGSEILKSYEDARRFDNTVMAAVTDGLNRLFSNNIMPVRIIRKLGLQAVSRLPAVKKFFMKQAMGGSNF